MLELAKGFEPSVPAWRGKFTVCWL